MLSKIDSNGVEALLQTIIDTPQTTKTGTTTSGQAFTNKETYWPYNYDNFYAKMVLDMTVSTTHQVKLNNGNPATPSYNNPITDKDIYSEELTGSNTIYLKIANIWPSNGNYSYTVKKLELCHKIYKPMNVKGYPRSTSIKAIWDFEGITLFWVHTDSQRISQIEGTSTEATTGNITLWNAIGYLEVNYNGSIVKVPYYN